jgi:hypothetical protein
MPWQADVPPGEFRLSTMEDPIHWACPDCEQPCRCVGVSRRMRHVRCGKPGNRDGEYDVASYPDEETIR